MKAHVIEAVAFPYSVRPRRREEPEERPRQEIQELVRPRVDAPLDDDEVVQRRHEQSFYVEKGGRLENVIGDLVSVASSMDVSAPSLILLEGISGSGRSALLAKVASVFATDAGKQYVLYFWKPPGCKFESALAAMASLLWLQLMGGRCMHKDSNKMKWKISDVFDVIQRASARSCCTSRRRSRPMSCS